jgi:hypothetical protein
MNIIPTQICDYLWIDFQFFILYSVAEYISEYFDTCSLKFGRVVYEL